MGSPKLTLLIPPVMWISAPIAPAQLGDRVEAVSTVLAVDGDREDQGIDEDPVQLDTSCERRFNHSAGVDHPFRGVRRHSQLAGGGNHDWPLESRRQVERLDPLERRRVEHRRA